MNHNIYRVSQIRVTAPYSLEIIFEDGKQKNIYFLPILKGEMYGPLAEESFFNKVYLDTEVHTITWPNGADFDPEILYNWEMYKDELVQRSTVWSVN